MEFFPSDIPAKPLDHRELWLLIGERGVGGEKVLAFLCLVGGVELACIVVKCHEQN